MNEGDDLDFCPVVEAINRNDSAADSDENCMIDEEEKEDKRVNRSEIARQHSFLEDRFVSEHVTVEEAYERVGGFGKFQIVSCVLNTMANMGAVFFLLAFAFLEK